jgi:anti-sigma regulatory factor (Ser/Thr protein kinase)
MAPPSNQDEHATHPRHPINGRALHSPTTLTVVLRADLVSPSIARDMLTTWLGGHAWPPARTIELVLALSEAVSNSIVHGYGVDADTFDHPGQIRVHAQVLTDRAGARHVEIVVSDDGGWREPPDGILPPGHGLFIINATAAEMIIDGHDEGTTITIRSHPIPPSPHR